MIFEIISGGEKLTGWGKNGPAHSFRGEKTDWGEIPACYTAGPVPEDWSAGMALKFQLYLVKFILPFEISNPTKTRVANSHLFGRHL